MSSLRIVVIVLAAVVGLALLRYRPWVQSAEHRAPSTEHAGAAGSRGG